MRRSKRSSLRWCMTCSSPRPESAERRGRSRSPGDFRVWTGAADGEAPVHFSGRRCRRGRRPAREARTPSSPPPTAPQRRRLPHIPASGRRRRLSAAPRHAAIRGQRAHPHPHAAVRGEGRMDDMVKVHSIRTRRRSALCHTGGTPGGRRFSYHLLAFSAAWRLLTRARSVGVTAA